jgi:hypothetical protein
MSGMREKRPHAYFRLRLVEIDFGLAVLERARVIISHRPQSIAQLSGRSSGARTTPNRPQRSLRIKQSLPQLCALRSSVAVLPAILQVIPGSRVRIAGRQLAECYNRLQQSGSRQQDS